jgi:hypothetical protein
MSWKGRLDRALDLRFTSHQHQGVLRKNAKALFARIGDRSPIGPKDKATRDHLPH